MANNAVGFLALFVALGGVGYAATGGFTSGGRLQACVNESGGLTLLKAGKHCKKGQKTVAWNQLGPAGVPGAKGATGAAGATGAFGANGSQGSPGPTTDVLPSGRTLRGWFNFDDVATVADQIIGGSIAFGLSLPSAPTVNIVAEEGAPTTQCPGSVAKPAATAGNLCIYEFAVANVSKVSIGNAAEEFPAADPFGAQVFVHSTAAGRFFAEGTWAVTA